MLVSLDCVLFCATSPRFMYEAHEGKNTVRLYQVLYLRPHQAKSRSVVPLTISDLLHVPENTIGWIFKNA